MADISRSMNKDQRDQLITFVNNLVDKLGVSTDGNHFSLTTFGPSATLHNNFKDANYHNANNFKKQEEKEVSVVPKKWGTRTDLALNLLVTRLFNDKGGDRPDAKNVVLVLTDGKPIKFEDDKQPWVPFSQSTNALEASQSYLNKLFFQSELSHFRLQLKYSSNRPGKWSLSFNF